MFYYVLNTNFEAVGLIDSFKSVIWTDRYQECGDFEIMTFPDKSIMDVMQTDYYLVNPSSSHTMIIEGREVDTDIDEGDYFIVTGRSLESILSRRIVWTQTSLNGNLQNGIKQLITDAFISPTVAERKVPNFIFKESTDERITSLKMEAQYTGDDLYEVIKDLCVENGIGFKITLDAGNNFVFELYKGYDRSYAQTQNPYVIFSQSFDNIIDSQYAETSKEYKNVSLVGGEGEGPDRKYISVGTTYGLLRREIFTDARDASSNKEDGTKMTTEEYNNILTARGQKDLDANKYAKTFEGEVDATQGFVYGKDFYLGDIVQVENEYKMKGPSLVSEIIWSEDENGYKCYPTFVAQNEDDKKEGEIT